VYGEGQELEIEKACGSPTAMPQRLQLDANLEVAGEQVLRLSSLAMQSPAVGAVTSNRKCRKSRRDGRDGADEIERALQQSAACAGHTALSAR